MVNQKTTAFCLACALLAAGPALAQKRFAKSAPRFLEAIQVASVGNAPVTTGTLHDDTVQSSVTTTERNNTASFIESASALQLKYAVLMDVAVEQMTDTTLFRVIDGWYGTRYVLGGSTKAGIDCSAFVQVLYAELFQTPMPRTAREQYAATQPISRTEMQEGDLLFFSTRGRGVSHVGMYLQNNKFVHAATSGGVMISDVFDSYWMQRFVGVGRYKPAVESSASLLQP